MRTKSFRLLSGTGSGGLGKGQEKTAWKSSVPEPGLPTGQTCDAVGSVTRLQ
ncbi:MAG: hypothetical protein K1Y36_29315 [Blastocatellia bacterium]|nr:hypothetical protein [Blastocatellia bacterium]